MVELIAGWFPLLVLPILLAIGVAYFAGRILRSRFEILPRPLRLFMAGLSPSASVFCYFYVWHKIDYAKHIAENGDVGYMGPALILIYGWPIWFVVAIGGFFLAAHIFRRTR